MNVLISPAAFRKTLDDTRAEARAAGVGRPARDELVAAARRRELDAVLVWRLDRWGRSLADLVTSLHELAGLGVAFVSLMEGFDLSTPAGRALAGLLGVFAEFERELRRERVALGLARARREGKHLGRPRGVSLATERDVRELAKTKSAAAVSRELGLPRSTVRRILARWK